MALWNKRIQKPVAEPLTTGFVVEVPEVDAETAAIIKIMLEGIGAMIVDVIEFHDRFDSLSKPKAAIRQAIGVSEEAAELVYALGTDDPAAAAKEAADTLYFLLGAIRLNRLSPITFVEAIYQTIVKNQAKQPPYWGWNVRETKIEEK